MENFIEIWKKKEITSCVMSFSCGGDSMEDYSFEFFTKEGVIHEDDELTQLKDYFDNEVFNRVEFYVNSDGIYMGESGIVEIVLDDDENDFSFMKSAESEFQESFEDVMTFHLTENEASFLREYVSNINGGDNSGFANYKKDFILNEEQAELMDKLLDNINNSAIDFEIENAEGEFNDWYSFTTDVEQTDSSDMYIDENNNLKVLVNKTYYTTRPSED